MEDGDGGYTGYGIELLSLISQYSHLNFEYVGYDKSWEEMQDMLERGEIDVVTSARKTRERSEIFAFSNPIERNNTLLSVQAENTRIRSGDYSTYDGMTVGLVSGSSQNQTLPDFARENGFTYRTREYSDPDQMEADLQNGTIDAILTSSLRRSENEKILDTIEVDYFYAITRKDDQALLDEINYALSQMNLYEADWANVLHHKYYGSSGSFSSNAFTQRERDYIRAVISGEKHITATAVPNRRPHSYAENGELKGIFPEFFDSLMKMAELPYEMIVPKDQKEYEQLRESGGVDVVVDWQQSASAEKDHLDNGFFTDAYMSTGTALLIRRDFSGPVTSLAVTEGQEGLPLEHERFKNARILSYEAPEDLLQAVLDGETDAAFLRTYAAQYFVNNDRTGSLQFRTVDSEQVVFNMFVSSESDHELITILNKCIHQIPDDVLGQLITKYTVGAPENVTFAQYMAAHPEMVFLLALLIALAVGAILFLYLRSRWNNKLLRTTERSKQALEEQLAIVNALSRDYLNVYTINLQTGLLRIVKLDGYQPPGLERGSKEEYPYTESLRRYIDSRVLEEDKEYLEQALSLEQVREELSGKPEYTGTYRVPIEGEILIFTAYDWNEIEAEAIEIGIDHFLPKPFFMSTFKEAVRRVMDGHPENEADSQADVVRDKHILVVDDVEINRLILVEILSGLGASCDEAGNGQEAVEAFERSQPGEYDLILMDVQMPVMDGYAASRAIRSSDHPSAQTVPIIAITANAFVDDVRDAIDSGMDAHIAKPIQLDKLTATIQQVLENRREGAAEAPKESRP